jgi:hypothetical protein
MMMASIPSRRGGFPLRALLLGSMLLLAALPLAVAHVPAECQPTRAFPSADGRFLMPGQGNTYYVPAGQFIIVLAGGPIDTTMVAWGSCGDGPCDEHGASGATTCVADVLSAVEVRNRGVEQQLVLMFIGVCDPDAICDAA